MGHFAVLPFNVVMPQSKVPISETSIYHFVNYMDIKAVAVILIKRSD